MLGQKALLLSWTSCALPCPTLYVLAEEFFEDILDEYFTEGETERQMDTIIEWCRYPKLFEYDATREGLDAWPSREAPHAPKIYTLAAIHR